MKGNFSLADGTYRCIECGALTRNTGRGEGGTGLCWACCHSIMLENQHSDDGHDEPVDGCPVCEDDARQAVIKATAAAQPKKQ